MIYLYDVNFDIVIAKLSDNSKVNNYKIFGKLEKNKPYNFKLLKSDVDLSQFVESNSTAFNVNIDGFESITVSKVTDFGTITKSNTEPDTYIFTKK